MKTDIVIGLQYGNEGTSNVIKQLLTYNKYTLGVHNAHNDANCIEIPVTSFYNINSLINLNCTIDTYAEKVLDAKLNDLEIKHETIRKYVNFVGVTKRVTKQICQCKTVDPLTSFKDTDLVLYHESQGFMFDSRWGSDPQHRKCDIGQMVSIGISPNTIRNTYGVMSMNATDNDECFNISDIITGIKINQVTILIINDFSNTIVLKIKHNNSNGNEISTFKNANEMNAYIHKVLSEYVDTIIFL
jgi:adenylosuccinate synthase